MFRIKLLVFISSFVIAVVLVACSVTFSSQSPAAQPVDFQADDGGDTAEKAHAVHWGYEGEGGPAHWGEIDPAFELCGTGVEQSPIDIDTTGPVNTESLTFSYNASAVTILNNGHTVQVNYDEGSGVEIDGETYHLLQFHFHSPSEHTLDGLSAPMEMHLVHANADGGLAVVGIMLVEGAENPAYAPIFNNMPGEISDAMAVGGATVNAADLLPADRSYFRYNGSLTTPPCSEGVKWHVMAQPVEISAEQIAAFTEIMEADNRPVQPINEREFLLSGHIEAGADTGHAIHWGYEGEGGPEHWGELEAGYELCGTGTEQSPIDLTAPTMTDLENVAFNYGQSEVHILNNGHTVQVNYDEGSHVVINGHTYNLLQFHFHAPSEHTVNGEHYPVEMHLVHADADGNLAVVGVFIAEGAENAAFASVWANLPASETAAMDTGATVNAVDLLPAQQTVYRYNGSLTTPPCSEGVLWSVMATPVEMSAEQIAAFTAIFDHDNRPVQPLNARELHLDATP